MDVYTHLLLARIEIAFVREDDVLARGHLLPSPLVLRVQFLDSYHLCVCMCVCVCVRARVCVFVCVRVFAYMRWSVHATRA